MNIKLDKDVRIRLDMNDVSSWKAQKFLRQQYRLGKQNIELEFRSDPKSTCSRIVAEEESLIVVLDREDSLMLSSMAFPKSGITIEDINIQVDCWGSEKRKKHETNLRNA